MTDLPISLPDSPESRLCAIENKIKCSEESTRAMKVYLNTLVPISRLPTEILSIIFSLLPSFENFKRKCKRKCKCKSYPPILTFTVSHVCHRWREISLNQPLLWNHIDFTMLSPAGAAEVLVRAKRAPLYLKARTTRWSGAKFKAFEDQIKAHVHHTSHLSIKGGTKHLERFGQLVSSAPSLESLSIEDKESSYISLSALIIPDNLFDGIVPKLTHLRLYCCGIRWQSPLLKGLRVLELFSFPMHAQIAFYAWLRSLEQMPQLERLVLRPRIPIVSTVLSDELKLIVNLPSLIELRISTSTMECVALLAHLVLPVLTRLCVNFENAPLTYESVNHLIQCVAQNAHGPQDTEALQSLFIRSNEKRADIFAWTMPRQDFDDGLRSSNDFPDKSRPARFEFSIHKRRWKSWRGENIRLYKALLAALPLNSIASLTIKGPTSLSEGGWRGHASGWPKLERVCLFHTTVPAFRAMFKGAAVLGGPLLPSLEELILVNISLDAQKVYYLCDMLIECVELGIPLKTLDLRTCNVANRGLQLLSEIVVDIQGPVKKESGDISGRRRERTGALGEEGGRDEEEDEFDRVTPLLGFWDIGDSDDDSDDYPDDSSNYDTSNSSGDDSWDDVG